MSNYNIPQEVYDLYDYYAHNKIDRRTFVDRLSVYAVGGLTLVGLMDHLMPKYESNIQVKADDPRMKSDYVFYESPKGGGTIRGLLATPDSFEGKLPGIVVVHENRGLNPYIEDVVRRAAVAGFIAIGPDALWPLGGYPGNDDKGREMQRERTTESMLEDFIAAYGYLANHPQCSGNIGVVGFCFGGLISNLMAVNVPTLKAAVPFYGGQAKAEDVPKIKAPLMLHFASLDTRVNEGWPAYETALKANNKEYTAHFYEEANHGFHNDSTPRYKEDAAKLAWERTIAFFNEKLK